ncbi:B12-binding domain-containing radical SAM protein [Candidatus Thorarchaeota archaeon]|nr:MAG: B12-binding domain-containing radical SAM protein [Candidatus Thorarchaeota archaeon]
MVRMSVVIVDALSAGRGTRRSSRDSIGCGPRTIAGVFEKHDTDCRIRRVEDLLGRGRTLKEYAHCAISAMSMDLPVVSRFIDLWRRIRPSGRVVLGGPIATDWRTALQECHPDVLIVGEGEATLSQLLQERFFHEDIDLAEIRGIGYEENGRFVYTGERAFISEEVLWNDFIPSTVRITDYRTYQASRVYVEVVRGCSNFNRTRIPLPDGRECSECGNCDSSDRRVRQYCPEGVPPGCGFCSVPNVWGPPRSRPKKSIVREVRDLIDLGVHRIVLEAPDFLDYSRGVSPVTGPCDPPANIEGIRGLLSDLMDIPEVDDGCCHVGIENMKACLFTDRVASTISELLSSVSPNIGIETGSYRHAEQIGKCGTPSDVLRAVETAAVYGMKPYVYFIYGLPGEDEGTVRASEQMMRKLSEAGAERIILYGFRALPGSAFEDFASASEREPLGTRLRSVAKEINRKKKTKYVGRTVRGIAAESSFEYHGYTMVYPMGEGPLMTVQGGYSPGTLVQVRIEEILSPGLVRGTVVSQG